MDALATWLPDLGIGYRWEERLGGRRRLPAGEPAEDRWWKVAQFAAYAAHTRTAEFTDALDGVLSDAAAELAPAMAQLRPRDRQLLWLAYAEAYSHHEIAEVTGLASPSIRLLLFRARRKMARLLREQGTAASARPLQQEARP